MKKFRLSTKDWLKAISIGVVTALLLSAIMVPMFMLGFSPLPKPLGLAFAETVFGQALPLPVGLLFHVLYVTVWSVLFIVLFRKTLTLVRAAGLGMLLWTAVLLVFFPVVGWGFFGLAIGPQLIVASFLPHLLFSLFLWGLCRIIFGREQR